MFSKIKVLLRVDQQLGPAAKLLDPSKRLLLHWGRVMPDSVARCRDGDIAWYKNEQKAYPP